MRGFLNRRASSRLAPDRGAADEIETAQSPDSVARRVRPGDGGEDEMASGRDRLPPLGREANEARREKRSSHCAAKQSEGCRDKHQSDDRAAKLA